jgi:hypothetical protein
MAAGTLNLTIEQGATFRKTLTWKTGTPAAAKDITNYTARMMLKSTPVREASQILSITRANPGVVTTKAAHKLVTGQSVVLPGVGGMVELNTRYTIIVLSTTTFSIGVDTTAFTTYTSGGVVAFVSLTSTLGDDGQLVLGGAAGTIGIFIKDSVTNTLVGGGSYDLEMVSPTPTFDVTRLVQGTFAANPNVTT